MPNWHGLVLGHKCIPLTCYYLFTV
jgi:hypothetical protein